MKNWHDTEAVMDREQVLRKAIEQRESRLLRESREAWLAWSELANNLTDEHFAAEPAQERERVPSDKVKVRAVECSD